jgi:UDP-N-acetylmuramyl pentapeptide phosphotransferase/UDP-N-acetylglucosamine-1-phosphate transferase
MKRYFWRYGVFISLFFLFTIIPFLTFATTVGDPSDTSPDPDTPIDGGLGILMAAGVGYGIKKWKDERKSNINKPL